MAFKKKYSRRSYRRSNKRKAYRKIKRKYKSAPRKTFVKSTGPFNEIYQCKLKYVDAISLTSTLGATVQQQYAFNDLYDPDYTGTGHQPMGFDQLATIYEKYQVTGMAYKISTLGFSDNSVACVNWSDSATVKFADWKEAAEQKYNKIRYLQQGSMKPTYLKGYMSTKRLLGLSKTDDLPYTAVSSSPSDRTFFNMLFQTYDEASTSSAEFVVTLTFYCKFTGRKQLSKN